MSLPQLFRAAFILLSFIQGGGRSVGMQSNTNLWHCNIAAHPGRRVHELAHAFLSRDIYNADDTISTGRWYDLMGNHDNLPMPSGYNMIDKALWYKEQNIVRLTFDDDYPMDKR